MPAAASGSISAGKPGPDVLDWLATVSGMSLDWQELPGDYLNLITQRSYTVEEARDLINRHLLARGYTLLVVNEVLSVAKTENSTPAWCRASSPRNWPIACLTSSSRSRSRWTG